MKFVDRDGKVVRQYNVTHSNNSGYLISKPGLSPKTEEAMTDYMKTKEGRAFVSQFAKEGDVVGGYKFTENGALSDHTLNIWDYSYSKETKNITAEPGSGSYSISKQNKIATVTIKVVSYSTDKAEIGEVLAHEMQIHGYKVADQINGKKVNSQNKDHQALKNKDTGHKGYLKYKSVQEQLLTIDKDYKQAFEQAQKEANILYK